LIFVKKREKGEKMEKTLAASGSNRRPLACRFWLKPQTVSLPLLAQTADRKLAASDSQFNNLSNELATLASYEPIGK